LLLAVTVTLLAGMTAATRADAGSLSGAGSTLVAPLETQWATAWSAQTGNNVSYQANGSGAGLVAVSSRSVDFAGIDEPLTSAQAGGCMSCVMIPWGLTAVVVPFHVGSLTKLKLTGNVLAKIYLGKITMWNDTLIQRLNPGIALPNLAITPVYENSSGQTYVMSDYLRHKSSAWSTAIAGTPSLTFTPTAVGIATSGDAGVAAEVYATNGAIGYVGASAAIVQGLPTAAIRNRAGKFEYANTPNIAVAGQSVKTVPSNNAPDIVDPGATFKLAYPISTFTYALVPTVARQASLLKAFLSYAIGPGQAYGPALDFAQLPQIVLTAAQNAISSLH
jgi:phosphate transport system substrate-binding protein